MEIEWDEAKRQDALVRHSVDFADVALIDFATARTVADNRRDYGEPRWVLRPDRWPFACRLLDVSQTAHTYHLFQKGE